MAKRKNSESDETVSEYGKEPGEAKEQRQVTRMPENEDRQEQAAMQRANRALDGDNDEDRDKPLKWRILTERAIIDGELYGDSDRRGGYGVVQLTREDAEMLQRGGLRLVECDEREEGEADEDLDSDISSQSA